MCKEPFTKIYIMVIIGQYVLGGDGGGERGVRTSRVLGHFAFVNKKHENEYNETFLLYFFYIRVARFGK